MCIHYNNISIHNYLCLEYHNCIPEYHNQNAACTMIVCRAEEPAAVQEQDATYEIESGLECEDIIHQQYYNSKN